MTKLAQTIAKKTEKMWPGLGYAIENGRTITSDVDKIVLIEPMMEIDGATRADEMPLPSWHAGTVYGEDTPLPQNFIADLRWTAKASASKDVRLHLNGISFQDGRIAATDGHRLHMCEAPYMHAVGTVPIEGIRALLALAREKGKATPVSVARADQAVRFTVGDCQLYIRLIEGKFPDTDRVIPRDVHSIGVDLTDIGAKYHKHFKGKFGPAVRVEHGEVVTPDSEIVARYICPEVDRKQQRKGTGFNMRYLADAKMKGGETRLRTDREAVLVKSDTRLAVIMGMWT